MLFRTTLPLVMCGVKGSTPLENGLSIFKTSKNFGYTLVDQTTQNTRELCSVICRNIWIWRNNFIFASNFDSPRLLLQQSQSLLLNFQKTQTTSSTIPIPNQSILVPRATRWQPPAHNKLKANQDTTLDLQTKTCGLSGIIRNEVGKVIASFCSKLEEVHNPQMAEALALRYAMTICAELRLKNVYFEGD